MVTTTSTMAVYSKSNSLINNGVYKKTSRTTMGRAKTSTPTATTSTTSAVNENITTETTMSNRVIMFFSPCLSKY